MNFPVPWRSLVPIDAVPLIRGASDSTLAEISSSTNAIVEISGDGETPATLSDKICTITGSVEQKEAACRRIVDKLRSLQEVADQEPGVFVIIVPSIAAPMVVGQKGAQIKEVIELSGAEISVGKENIVGMLDQPIGITGTGGQVVSAVSKINAILQDLADRAKLQPSDFRYRAGAVQGTMSMEPSGPRGLAPMGGNPRTHAKFVVATQVAGWIIGKQGRHIRELQENSGAHIQVLREGEVPPGVPPTDRVVEIGGRFEARSEGIQIVLMAVDSMPALQAPRETLMLIPKVLSTDMEIKEVQQMSGAEIEVRDLPGYDEALCTLIGTIEARVKAAQQFLTRIEEVVMDGTVGAESNLVPPRQAAPPPAAREPPPVAREPPPAAREPPPLREAPKDPWSSGPPSAGPQDPWSQGDPWSHGLTGAPGTAGRSQGHGRAEERQPMATAAAPNRHDAAPHQQRAVTFTPEPEVLTFGSQPSSAPAPTYNEPLSEHLSSPMPRGGDERTSFRPDPAPQHSSGGGDQSMRPMPEPQALQPGGQAMSFKPEPAPRPSSGGHQDPGSQHASTGSQPTCARPDSVPQHGAGGHVSFSPDGGQSHSGGGSLSFGSNGPQGRSTAGQTSFSPAGEVQVSGGQMSFGPDATQGSGTAGRMSFSPDSSQSHQTSGQMRFGPESSQTLSTSGQMSFGPDGSQSHSALGRMTFSPDSSQSHSTSVQMSFAPNGSQNQGACGQMSFSPDSNQSHSAFGRMSFAPNVSQSQGACGQMSFGPDGSQGLGACGRMSFSPDGVQSHSATGQMSFSQDSSQSHGACSQKSFSPDGMQISASGQTSFSPDAIQRYSSGSMPSSFSPGMSSGLACSSTSTTSFSPACPLGHMGMSGLGGLGALAGMGGVGGLGGLGMMGNGMAAMGLMNPMGSLAGMGAMGPMGPTGLVGAMGMLGMGGGAGAMGGGDMALSVILQSSMAGQLAGQLLLLLPVDLLQQALVPHGHLAEIAQKCQIRIDLGAEVHPNLLQVSLSGSLVANAMAAYFLQERAAQYSSGAMV